jgi:hypothetical protein
LAAIYAKKFSTFLSTDSPFIILFALQIATFTLISRRPTKTTDDDPRDALQPATPHSPTQSTSNKMSGDKSTTATTAAAASTANPPPVQPTAAEAIEEDDEFEEFEPCRWDAHDEDAEDSQQWQVRRTLLSFYGVKWCALLLIRIVYGWRR